MRVRRLSGVAAVLLAVFGSLLVASPARADIVECWERTAAPRTARNIYGATATITGRLSWCSNGSRVTSGSASFSTSSSGGYQFDGWASGPVRENRGSLYVAYARARFKYCVVTWPTCLPGGTAEVGVYMSGSAGGSFFEENW